MRNKEFGIHYTVVGAGEVRLSHDCNSRCGGKVGFSFGVSWSEHPYTGGVISMEEAKALADHIYRQLSKTDEYKTEIRKSKIDNLL